MVLARGGGGGGARANAVDAEAVYARMVAGVCSWGGGGAGSYVDGVEGRISSGGDSGEVVVV